MVDHQSAQQMCTFKMALLVATTSPTVSQESAKAMTSNVNITFNQVRPLQYNIILYMYACM